MLLCHMATQILINIGSRNGLLPWWHQELTGTNDNFSFMKLSGIHMGAISQRVQKNMLLKLLPHLLGTDELIVNLW